MCVSAAPIDDLVKQLPDFDEAPFDVYSGYLEVPGPFNLTNYDKLMIHYQFHTSQSNSSTSDPLVTWHQGGPGGSSLYGLYGELGFFQLDDRGPHTNPYSWNSMANMLYLESPAGSSNPIGFSWCEIEGEVQDYCSWDDVSQAEAYTHTLRAFFAAFPEYSDNDLYLSGESYAGQYLPNIAYWMLNSDTNANQQISPAKNLRGIAVGNGCWGGDENTVICNGIHSEQNDLDMYWGKGLISKKLYDQTYAACGYEHDTTSPSPFLSQKGKSAAAETGNVLNLDCEYLLEQCSAAVGTHNVYNIYDNCEDVLDLTAATMHGSGKSMRWLKRRLRDRLSASSSEALEAIDRELAAAASKGGVEVGSTAAPTSRTSAATIALEGTSAVPPLTQGGFQWGCNQMNLMAAYLARADVMEALHLTGGIEPSSFRYKSSGPASITLYPTLATQIRVLIYNGDADACVPYKGNEEWTAQLEAEGVLVEKAPWHPWTVDSDAVPAGYATTYSVPGAPSRKKGNGSAKNPANSMSWTLPEGGDFAFITIRLAGHMVPAYQPRAALSFFERFLKYESF